MKRLGRLTILLFGMVVLASCDLNMVSVSPPSSDGYQGIDLTVASAALPIVASPTTGVILEELQGLGKWQQIGPIWRLLVRRPNDDGVVVLSRCDTDQREDVAAVAAPGDLISWSPKGNDNKVCAKEISVLALGVALRPAPGPPPH